MTRSLHILFIFIGFAALTSCTERVDIVLEQEYTKLVVEGYLTPSGETFRYVHLTTTAGYFSNEPPPQVSGATISIEEGDQVYLFSENMGKPGYYLPPDDLLPEQEKTYLLKIDLAEEIAGVDYFEATETMPPLSSNFDSIRTVYDPDFEYWAIEFYGYDPPETNFYMFNALRNGDLITDTIWKVNVTDDVLINGNYIYGAYVMFFDGEDLNPGDEFTLITSSITEEYYNYVIELQTEISPSIPLFSGPPANVSTNISEGAVGYFATFPSSTMETIVVDNLMEK